MSDPSLWAIIVGLGGFTAWLLKDYISYLKAVAERERLNANEWKALAMQGVNGLEKAVDKVPTAVAAA